MVRIAYNRFVMREKNSQQEQAEAEELPTLEDRHYRMLRYESGISDEIIKLRGYRSIREPKELRALGFSQTQDRPPGLLLPVHCTDGTNGLHIYRPDLERIVVDKKKRGPDGLWKAHAIKYEMPRGYGVRLDCPIPSREHLANPNRRLWITEGIKKADALASHGETVIDLLGVWNFVGRNAFNGVTFLADWKFVTLPNREVIFVFDSDVMTKQGVKQALNLLVEILSRKGPHISIVYLQPHDGHKVGVDDYLAPAGLNHSIDDLLALIEGPRFRPKLAPATIELLLDEPATMRRPIGLFGDHAYVSIWPLIKVSQNQRMEKDGTIVKLEQPEEVTERYPLVVRSDGAIFRCRVDDNLPLELAPGLEFRLDTIPEEKQLWSTRAVQAFRDGKRPDPLDVFQRIVDVVNHHIDFDRSLAEQETMCEMIACYILSTWFLDAFQVIGYLWPNGEFGSGKSELLKTVSQMAFLGEMVMAQSTIATIRDAADYGATLCFDEVERLQQDKTKSDLLAILLAGNTRGATMAAKEPGPNGQWVTRRFNCFCPRLFAAIRLPDGALASRTIFVPLVRSTDRDKSTRMVMDVTSWPHSRQKLIDDLWPLVLLNLKAVKVHDSTISEHTALRGRQLEPWRSMLAIGLWLEPFRPGVFERLHKLAQSYQGEVTELDTGNITKLVIRALDFLLSLMPAKEPAKESKLFNADTSDTADTFSGVTPRNCSTTQILKTEDVTSTCRDLNTSEELGIPEELLLGRGGATRIGRVLKRLRFSKHKVGHASVRGWAVTQSEVNKLKLAFGLHTPEEVSEVSEVSASVENATVSEPQPSEVSASPEVSAVEDIEL